MTLKPPDHCHYAAIYFRWLSVDKSVHRVLLNALHDQLYDRTDDPIYDPDPNHLNLNAPVAQVAFAFHQQQREALWTFFDAVNDPSGCLLLAESVAQTSTWHDGLHEQNSVRSAPVMMHSMHSSQIN